jgi:hypothetical protein
MQNIFSRVILAFGALAMVGSVARAQDVTYNYASGTDFAKFKTYRWIELPAAEKPNALLDQQIREAIDANLAKKGLTKATGETSDLLVAYQLAVSKEQQWNAYTTGGYGYGGYGWRYGGMGGGTTTATSTTLNVGTLAFDTYDTAAKKLVWKGTATKTLNPSKDPKKNQERLQKAMDKLLKNFPPKDKT